jgi:hypothetical protein
LTVTPGAADAAVAPDINAVPVSNEKVNNNGPVQQLDSTMILPIIEMGIDPLGSIPELPASEKRYRSICHTTGLDDGYELVK